MAYFFLIYLLFCLSGIAASQLYVAYIVYGNQKSKVLILEEQQETESTEISLEEEARCHQAQDERNHRLIRLERFFELKERSEMRHISFLRDPEEEVMEALAESLQLREEQIH